MGERDVYIGIGSNLDPGRHIPAALAALETSCGPLAVSPWYRSAPLGFAGPDFINGVVRARSTATFPRLRSALKGLERQAGRAHSRRLATRELDLDILLYGGERFVAGGSTIPRPDILDYAFVLRPLAELAPEVKHPATGRSFAWHWRHFTGERIALAPARLEAREKNGRGDRI